MIAQLNLLFGSFTGMLFKVESLHSVKVVSHKVWFICDVLTTIDVIVVSQSLVKSSISCFWLTILTLPVMQEEVFAWGLYGLGADFVSVADKKLKCNIKYCINMYAEYFRPVVHNFY